MNPTPFDEQDRIATLETARAIQAELARVSAQEASARRKAEFVENSWHANTDGGIRIFLGASIALLCMTALLGIYSRALGQWDLVATWAGLCAGLVMLAWGGSDALAHAKGATALRAEANRLVERVAHTQREADALECRQRLDAAADPAAGEPGATRRL